MNIEILHTLLKYSPNKDLTIREYLDENIQKKLEHSYNIYNHLTLYITMIN